MKSGSKRKASQKEDSKSPDDLSKESTKGSSRGKRAKVLVARTPESEPEYFPDNRNLEDLWKIAFPVGTEWDQLNSVHQFNWNFYNLKNALEYNGELHGKKVYLFGCTETQLLRFKGEKKLIHIPAVVAVVSPFPPSDKICVRMETEEIISMSETKMDWVPYIPLKDRDNQVERWKLKIFILSCTQRRDALRHLKLEHSKKYAYLPYFHQPVKEDELEQSRVVQILYPAEPEPVVCEFHLELDELEEFTDDLIEREQLSEDQIDSFKEFVKQKIREARKIKREAREAQKKALEEMSEDTRAALENMRFYKFYPVRTPDTPDVSKVKVIF
ncbi:protein HEAT INTOLERANT 4-like [Telopea speciosissima]|uniref:protein HEAT INTOLERANT 4-like n=1 Tax=Telopea speciosissima TaxID=54955 RepID=UPI001CC80F7F|nr:protein HEAT INTOLERANT 4-like [Telopea speciosissima]